MSRFLGLVLMLTTGAVAAPLVTAFIRTESVTIVALAFIMAGLGLLFGFLATDRHVVWAITASVVIVGSMALNWAQPPSPQPLVVVPPTPGFRMVLYAVPPVALLLFSALGARMLHRKVKSVTTPADE